MRVLVCGSRTFTDDGVIWNVLDGYYQFDSIGYLTTHLQPFVVIEGGAAGADRSAGDWLYQSPLHPEVSDFVAKVDPDTAPDYEPLMHMQFQADWGQYGKRAGYIRNQQMLDEGKPDLVFAFVDKPLAESKGTAMMVDIARKSGVKTYVIEAL